MDYKKGKALPEKIGSLQTFMHGYQGELICRVKRVKHSY